MNSPSEHWEHFFLLLFKTMEKWPRMAWKTSMGMQWLLFQKEKIKNPSLKNRWFRETERSLPADFQNQKWHEGDEHRTQCAHFVTTQELQSIRGMLLPLANAWVTTGYCRGQNYLNGAKKSVRKRHWRKSSQGLLKAIRQVQAQAEEAPQSKASLPGRAGPKHFAFPSCPHQQPSLLSHKPHKILG